MNEEPTTTVIGFLTDHWAPISAAIGGVFILSVRVITLSKDVPAMKQRLARLEERDVAAHSEIALLTQKQETMLGLIAGMDRKLTEQARATGHIESSLARIEGCLGGQHRRDAP